MCESNGKGNGGVKTVPLGEAVGTVLAHDITEIRPGETFAEGGRAPFKGRAFKKGHVIGEGDIPHLRRLGKERLYILELKDDEAHEDEAARSMAEALSGPGVAPGGEPKEGKVNLIASRDGLLKVNKDALCAFNMLGEVMCSTLHENTVVKAGRLVAGTRAIPLVVNRKVLHEAIAIAQSANGVIEVKEIRKPRAGIVITGGEVFNGRVKDAFAPIIRRKVEEFGGDVVGLHYAPDDENHITQRLGELLGAGADLLITTGGMSVDPDDVTRFAIRRLGGTHMTYGSAVLPGAMFLTAYIGDVPIMGIPACGMYHKTTVLDLILPRVLAGERIGRRELAELGHGGLCLNCTECRFPVCPFGKC
jgi:hypothetical protein